MTCSSLMLLEGSGSSELEKQPEAFPGLCDSSEDVSVPNSSSHEEMGVSLMCFFPLIG